MRHHHHHPPRRNRLPQNYRWATYFIVALVWCSGAAWLLFHYFLAHQGEFGAEPNPLEIWWLRLHGVGTFAVLWLAGALWIVHVRTALAMPRRRPSGILLLVIFAILTISGFLLYYGADGNVRDWTAVVHWCVGLAVVLPLLWHALRAGRRDDSA